MVKNERNQQRQVGESHSLTRLQCISINHNFFSSPTLSSVFTALEASQQQVEDSLADVKGMIQQRLGAHPDSGWEEEWVEEVQKVLEMDAGWGWKGFWETVRMNLLVRVSVDLPSTK